MDDTHWYSPFDQPKTGLKNQLKINSSTYWFFFLTHPLIYQPPTLTNNLRTLTLPPKKLPTRSLCQIPAPNVDTCRGSQYACCLQPPVQTTTTTHVTPPTPHCHVITQLEYVTRTQACMRRSSHFHQVTILIRLQNNQTLLVLNPVFHLKFWEAWLSFLYKYGGVLNKGR